MSRISPLHKEYLPNHALYWGTFEEALKITFGEPNPVNTATYSLDNLRMQGHHRITKYNIEFNE